MFANLVSILAGQIAYPLDTVRRRMMMQAGRPANEILYSGPFDCMQKIYKREGIRALYKGAMCNVIRSSAWIIFTYDTIKVFKLV